MGVWLLFAKCERTNDFWIRMDSPPARSQSNFCWDAPENECSELQFYFLKERCIFYQHSIVAPQTWIRLQHEPGVCHRSACLGKEKSERRSLVFSTGVVFGAVANCGNDGCWWIIRSISSFKIDQGQDKPSLQAYSPLLVIFMLHIGWLNLDWSVTSFLSDLLRFSFIPDLHC